MREIFAEVVLVDEGGAAGGMTESDRSADGIAGAESRDSSSVSDSSDCHVWSGKVGSGDTTGSSGWPGGENRLGTGGGKGDGAVVCSAANGGAADSDRGEGFVEAGAGTDGGGTVAVSCFSLRRTPALR